jgi:ribosome-associated protein
METFALKTPYIELIKLVKLLGWAENGGQARALIQNRQIQRNGSPETRVKAKLVAGDRITFKTASIMIEAAPNGEESPDSAPTDSSDVPQE